MTLLYNRRHFCYGMAAATSLAAYPSFGAGNYALPNKPITVIVPFSQGGTGDLLVRTLQPVLQNILQREVVVQNVAGKGGTLGTLQAALSAPDGTTLLSGNLGTHASAPALYGNTLRYNADNDFMPIAMIASTPVYLVGRTDLTAPDNTPIQDFATLKRTLVANPWRYVIAHLGKGSTSHLAALHFMQLTKTSLQQLIYRGAGPALRDLSDGVFDLFCDQSASLADDIRNKTIRPFLYANNTISPLDANLPNATSVGLPEISMDGWNMLFAPRGTPDEAIALFNRAMLFALKQPQIVMAFNKYTAIILPEERNTPDDLRRFVRREQGRWSSVLQSARLSTDEHSDVEED